MENKLLRFDIRGFRDEDEARLVEGNMQIYAEKEGISWIINTFGVPRIISQHAVL